MGYLPIFLDLTGLRCMVIGGGKIGARKVEALLEAGAAVTVVSPQVTPLIAALADRGQIARVNRKYQPGDMRGCALVYAATNRPEVHRALAREARELGIPLNVVDVPELCSFITPAVMRQGALQIAISTTGASPAFAARIKRELEVKFGVEYGFALEILRAVRKHLRTLSIEPAERSRRLKELACAPLTDTLRSHDPRAVERILATYLGHDVTLSALGLDPASLGLSPKLGVPG